MALITDGRFSGATRGLMVGHVAPEAALGGPIAAIREGDIVHIDVQERQLELQVPDHVIRERLSRYHAAPPRYANGVFAKYAALVSSAAVGAVTRPPT